MYIGYVYYLYKIIQFSFKEDKLNVNTRRQRNFFLKLFSKYRHVCNLLASMTGFDLIIKQYAKAYKFRKGEAESVEIGLERSEIDIPLRIYRLGGSWMSHIVLSKTRLIVRSIVLSLKACVLWWKDLPVKQISGTLSSFFKCFQVYSFPTLIDDRNAGA